MDTGAEKRPEKPAVKLPTIVGHNTATRSLFNRTWQSTEKVLRGQGGIKKGQERLGVLDKEGARGEERREDGGEEPGKLLMFYEF